MTVVLAYSDRTSNAVFMAGDSCASDQIYQSLIKNPKVFHPVGRRDILIGCAGSFRMLNLMQHVNGIFPPENELATDDIDITYLVTEFTPVIKALTEDFDEDDPWEMLIAVGSRIYRIQMDLSVLEPTDNCDAIGIGGPVALGAFKVLNELAQYKSVEERMKHALTVACSSCKGCSAPFTVAATEQCLYKCKHHKNNERHGYKIVRSSSDNSYKNKSKSDKKLHKKRKERKQ